MDTAIFQPKRKQSEKYAVALRTDGEFLCIVHPYHSREQLEKGYKEWYELASQKGLTKPVPIEILDDNGTCRILDDLLIAPEKN